MSKVSYGTARVNLELHSGSVSPVKYRFGVSVSLYCLGRFCSLLPSIYNLSKFISFNLLLLLLTRQQGYAHYSRPTEMYNEAHDLIE